MQVYIPRELVNSNEKTKKFFVNDKMISVPIGQFVDCSEEVGAVIVDWIKGQEALRAAQEKRAEDLRRKSEE